MDQASGEIVRRTTRSVGLAGLGVRVPTRQCGRQGQHEGGSGCGARKGKILVSIYGPSLFLMPEDKLFFCIRPRTSADCVSAAGDEVVGDRFLMGRIGRQRGQHQLQFGTT